MCPLRLILIFLSATLAGFFVLRNLRSQPSELEQKNEDTPETSDSSKQTLNNASSKSKILAAFVSGFWTFVDMASGRYLWRQLQSNNSSSCL